MLRSRTRALTRFTQQMDQVCTSLILVRIPFLRTPLNNYISQIFCTFPLSHIIYSLFINSLMIIMYFVTFTLLISFLRIRIQGTCSLEVATAMGFMRFPSLMSTPQFFSGVRVSSSQWHSCLGHPATPIVRHVLHRHELPVQSSRNNDTVCDACQEGKSHQLPFSESSRVVKTPLELVFADVWGSYSNICQCS
jgi:hypothetical protein